MMKQYDDIIIGFGKAERRWLPNWLDKGIKWQ